jgi:uncharacterized Zn finger protein (UPF0148 family)
MTKIGLSPQHTMGKENTIVPCRRCEQELRVPFRYCGVIQCPTCHDQQVFSPQLRRKEESSIQREQLIDEQLALIGELKQTDEPLSEDVRSELEHRISDYDRLIKQAEADEFSADQSQINGRFLRGVGYTILTLLWTIMLISAIEEYTDDPSDANDEEDEQISLEDVERRMERARKAAVAMQILFAGAHAIAFALILIGNTDPES